MPIHFRCPSCYGLLSIARRKAGQEVTCPKCQDRVIVPTPPELEDEQTVAVEIEADTRKSPYRGAADVPRRRAEDAAPRQQSLPPVMLVDPPQSQAPEAVAAVASPVPGKSERKPGRGVKSDDPSELPLFERSDVIDALLNPAAKQATSRAAGEGVGARGLAGTSTAAANRAVQNLGDSAKGEIAANSEQGLFITRGAAIMLAILVFLLLGLSFAAGFLAGS